MTDQLQGYNAQPEPAFVPEIGDDIATRRPSRPMVIPVNVCPLCGGIMPSDVQVCELCYDAETNTRRIDTLPPQVVDRLRQQVVRLYREISPYFAQPMGEGTLIDLPDEEALQELQQQQLGPIVSVDLLAADEWRPYTIPTKAAAEVVEVVGKDRTRRSVTITNQGSDSAAAADVWLGNSREIQARGFNTRWLQPGASISFDHCDAIFAIDDGANATLLTIDAIYIR